MDLIKLYEAGRVERGKKIELLGNKERKEFLSIYPVESIPNLTIEQYVIGNDNSFSHWLCYKLRHVASMGGNMYPNAFGVYTKKTSWWYIFTIGLFLFVTKIK